MIPHSGKFVLVLSFTLISSLHSASLKKDDGQRAWTHRRASSDRAEQIRPASSSPWTSQTSTANVDTTLLFPDDTVSKNYAENMLKDEEAALTMASNPFRSGIESVNVASSKKWTENTNFFKTDTQKSDTNDSVRKLSSSESTLLPGLGSSPHPASIRPEERALTPAITNLHVYHKSTNHRELQTKPSVSHGTGLEQRQTDQGTTEQVNQKMPEEFTKKPPRGITVVNKFPEGSLALDVWNESNFTKSSSLPDCNIDTTGVCNSSNPLLSHGLPDNSLPSAPASASPKHPPGDMTPPPVTTTPPLLVPLYSDWNAAMATWGLAWELQVYGLGCVFLIVAVLSVLSLLCLPLCQPSGCASFSFLHLVQLLIGSSRAFWLLYDPYGQRERLPVAWARLLHEIAYPCLSGAFGLLLLLLSPQLISQNSLRRCFYLFTALILLHTVVVLGSVGILWLFPGLPVLSLLPPAAFVLLSCFFSCSYLLFYCCARVNVKHIYRLKENSPDHLACQSSHCPLPHTVEAGVWEQAAETGLFSAFFLLICGGLRLYGILNAVGLLNGGRIGLMPWPWWAFQVSCRVCEACVCLTLALILTQPLLCCGVARPKLGRWSSWFNRSSTGAVLAKPQILSSGWSKKSGENLGLQGSMMRHESESVPLYTLAELPLSETEGLDLACSLAPTQLSNSPQNGRTVSQPSFISLDFTADLRPPTPIDLRRSIDEALNSEAFFQRSLFSSSRLSLSTRGPPDGQPCRGTPAEPCLYRTASCGDVDLPTTPSPPMLQSNTVWRSSNSRSLHSGPRSHGGQTAFYCGFGSGRHSQRQYRALGSVASKERLYDQQQIRTQADELASQAEFINVCRQIDALSVSSDTIEL
ncbi:proline-rich transmembrane protein 4 [Trichomycterus rosablanca]|uniref:proline-rich transmembrane protein 4 n=1 Tax=Trichomycterus rosablanca TaxID=2290929 RepID=UPI002F354423